MKTKVLWLLTFLPFLLTLIALPMMADQIPAHYNMEGIVDRWGSKYESFIFPMIIFVCTLFWSLLIKYYQKREEICTDDKDIQEAKQNKQLIYYSAVLMCIAFTIMHCFMMYDSIVLSSTSGTTMSIDSNHVTTSIIGILLIFIGNKIPKSRINSVVGLRTAWSMKSDQSWAKSNRFAGKILLLSGLNIFIGSFFIDGFGSLMVMIGIVVVDVIVCTIYSYFAYKSTVNEGARMNCKDQMWQAFLASGSYANSYESWAFGGDSDALANLVLKGIKTATTSAYEFYELENEPLPIVGSYHMILDSKENPVCIIQITKVEVKEFQEVSSKHARKEGEGDLSLEYYREVHKQFFTHELNSINKPFDETMLVVCEEFQRVFPVKTH